MMYRCESCGHLFEDGEQAVWEERHGLDTPPYEQWSGCPICKGGYEEVHQCKKCGDWHVENDIYYGWCVECLKKEINYDSFLEYCEANKDENYLELFVMQDLLNCDDVPKNTSLEFHDLMKRVFDEERKRAEIEECIWKNKTDLLDRCIRFIMEDDGSIGIDNFAYWLNDKKEVK